MRLLFALDKKDYENCTHSFVRNSARAVIISGNKIAMVHSLKYDYYKFPGGGIEKGETPEQAVIRETREEAGLAVIPETVTEYGYVHRIKKSDTDDTECFIQDNFYFLCKVEAKAVDSKPDDYEKEEGFTLEFIEPETAIIRNRSTSDTPYDPVMFEREARVLQMLIEEGYFEE